MIRLVFSVVGKTELAGVVCVGRLVVYVFIDIEDISLILFILSCSWVIGLTVEVLFFLVFHIVFHSVFRVFLLHFLVGILILFYHVLQSISLSLLVYQCFTLITFISHIHFFSPLSFIFISFARFIPF